MAQTPTVPAAVQQPPEPQPTVRVMRLYKPSMHIMPTMPPLSNSENDSGSNFAVSPYLLLPDCFGEIFVGQNFSAYIGVVNGSLDTDFSDVSLSVRLQTSNSSNDLLDFRSSSPGQSGQKKALGPNESLDMVVKHQLVESGTHTLRVTVTYLTRSSQEVKTIRKFYRFSAFQPLQVASSCSEFNDKVMIQCQVTNVIKLPVYVEKMKFEPHQKGSIVSYLEVPGCTCSFGNGDSFDAKMRNVVDEDSNVVVGENGDDLDSLIGDTADPMKFFNLNSLQLLQPTESYGYAVTVQRSASQVNTGHSTRIIGVPEVTWCLGMGERGVTRGEDVVIPAGAAAGLSSFEGRGLKLTCVHSPKVAYVGVDFEVQLRITNNTSQPVSVNLMQSREHSPTLQAVTSARLFSGLSSPWTAANQAPPPTAIGSPVRPASAALSPGSGAFQREASELSMSLGLSAAMNSQAAALLSAAANSSSSQLAAGSSHSSLCVTGLASFKVGVLKVGEYVDTVISVCPLSAGLQELKGLVAVDTSSGREFPSGSLLKIFVQDDGKPGHIENLQ